MGVPSLRARDSNNIPVRHIHVAPNHQIALIRLEIRLHCEGAGVWGLGTDSGASVAVGVELAWGVRSGREADALDGAECGVGSGAVEGVLEIDPGIESWAWDDIGDGDAGAGYLC